MFFIVAYPKSRTTWLSCFLHDSLHPCYHEKSSEFSSFEQMKAWCEDNPTSGLVDTILVSQLDNLFTVTDKVILVNRDKEEVAKSIVRDGFKESDLDWLHSYVEAAKTDRRVKVVDYDDLSEEDAMKDLCEYIGIEFQQEKFRMFSECLIATDIEKFMSRVINSKVDHSWLLGNKK